MRANSNIRPETLLPLGNGKHHFNYNVVEMVREDEIGYDYNYVLVCCPSYGNIVSAMIAEKYSLNQELSLHRQKDVKIDEFAEYFNYCEECKQIVREKLNIEQND